MSNINFANKNENVIYRETRDTILEKDSFDILGLYNVIYNELNKTETKYLFPNKNEEIVYINDKNKYNLFCMHDIQMHSLFQKIVILIKNTCLKHEFSYLKNRYYVYASLVEDQDPAFWYDAGGTSRPSMFGIISLDSNKTQLSINETIFDLEPGDIVLSEAGNKIIYSRPFKSIVFYVSPLSEIKNQYSQKWIPLV